MSEKRGKRKRGGTIQLELVTEKKRKSKRGKKEQIDDDDDVIIVVDRGRERSDDILGKREQEGEQEEEVVMKRRREKEERGGEEEEMKKKKRFECGICLELISWEKEPKILPCCGFSFCFLCLNKLFLLQNPSTTSSSSPSPLPPSLSSSSSSSSFQTEKKKKGVKCPVCRKVNECEKIETLQTNYLIPETIDILLSSSVMISSSPKQQPASGFPLSFFSALLVFFLLLFLMNCMRMSHLFLKNKKIEEETKCVNFESCGKQTRMYCSDCNLFICDSCDSFHSTSIFSRNHKRTEQQQRIQSGDDGVGDDGGDDELEKLKKRECSKHSSQVISGYCFECCTLVCVRCILETHGKHKEKVNFLEESVLKKRDEVVKIGDRLEKRLIEIEKKRKEIEEEMKELEEKLEKKRIEKKEIELEKEDLRIRKDSIIRLSNTPSDVSLFDDQLFSTLLQTANDIVSEGGVGLKPKKGVIRCDSNRFRFVSSFPLKSKPRGMSVNSDGNLFICESESGLKVRDKEGNEIESTIQKTIDSLQLKPYDVSIGLDDQIVVLDWSRDSHRVVILNKEGELIKSFGSKGSQDGQFDKPFGVDVDGEGRIIVSDTHNYRIQVFENDGSFIRSFGSRGSSENQFYFPYGVVVDRDGNIVVCDCGNHQIKVVDIEGNLIRCFGTFGSGDSQLYCPISVDVDGEGRIVVSEDRNERVNVFEKDGTFLFSFGKGQMKQPRGVVVDSFGSIIVSGFEKKLIEFWN